MNETYCKMGLEVFHRPCNNIWIMIMVQVVFHIDAEEKARLGLALNNTTNLLKEIGDDGSGVALVLNGPGAKLMTGDMDLDLSSTIERLSKKGVKFYVCNNSLTHFEIEPGALHKSCEVVKAGVLKLVELQAGGYAYVKP